MNRFRNSIRGRLFAWICAFTSLFLIAVALLTYLEVRETVFNSVDTTLHSKAQVITGLLHEEKGSIELELEEVVSGDYSIPRSGHYFKVLMDGKLFAAAPSLVNSSFDLAAGALETNDTGAQQAVFTSTGPGDEPIRVLQYDLNAFGKTFRIFVAESLDDSLDMIRKFRHFLLMVIPTGILVVSLMAMWLAKQSLKPLEQFSGRIRSITDKTLDKRVDTESETAEMADLAESFNDMLDRLQKAFESEKRLIADASHELKTPVSVLMLQCDVILQQKRTAEQYIDALTTIRSVSDGIGATVKNLLLLARLDSGILSSKEFESLSLNTCIQQTVAMLQPFVEKRSIQLLESLGADTTVVGNMGSLTEAFLNILENGVKYNRDNGVLEVSTTWNGAEAVVSIRDSGIGIAKEDQERVFDRFYRADSARNADGTGLGLSIARAIIAAHGGTISLASELGLGSAFTITLPGFCADATKIHGSG
ncbi:MAG: ATP-binding protein [Desulfuromonadaceae bacterium]|nr:ATP-binding protein [Desulfuromonadaceae bacterium]